MVVKSTQSATQLMACRIGSMERKSSYQADMFSGRFMSLENVGDLFCEHAS